MRVNEAELSSSPAGRRITSHAIYKVVVHSRHPRLRGAGFFKQRNRAGNTKHHSGPMGAPALYPGGLGVVLMFLLMTLVTPVEATAGTVVAILLGTFCWLAQASGLS